MSQNLYWRPKEKLSQSLPDALKFILRDRTGLDGTPHTYDQSNIEYLSGLRDAGIDGAVELIEAIEHFGRVEVWLE